MNYRTITIAVRSLLVVLITAWIVAIINHPIHLEPDSHGYINDAKNLFDPAYVSQRPPLYPAWLWLFGNGSTLLSLICFLVNALSLLYLVHLAGNHPPSGWRKLFSLRNSIILVFFFVMSAIWSYCATVLTESILFAVEIWIFIFLVKVFNPEKPWRPLTIIFCSIAISVLALTLKPWIMVMVLLAGFLLLIAAFVSKAFRPHRRAAALLLAICSLAFLLTYTYNKSKSFESANAVVLMISTPREIADLGQRLNNPSNPDTVFIRQVLSDISLINSRYSGNPWHAAAAGNLEVLDISKQDKVPAIRKAFHLMYVEHWQNTVGLAQVALSRYFVKLKSGLSSLDIVYGPDIRLIRNIDFPFISIVSALCIFYYFRIHRKKVNMQADSAVTIFTTILFFSGLIFAVALTLAGTDLRRVVYTGIPFQLFALAYFLLRLKSGVN